MVRRREKRGAEKRKKWCGEENKRGAEKRTKGVRRREIVLWGHCIYHHSLLPYDMRIVELIHRFFLHSLDIRKTEEAG